MVNLLRLPPHAFLNRVFAWAVERVEHGKLDEWKSDLAEPLPWQDSDGDSAIELESESFFAAQAKGGG